MLIALESYADDILGKIVKNRAVSGAVLGDFFCNYRMFAGGDVELSDRMRQLKAAGKKVFYQTPRYLTDMVFEQTLRNILYWSGCGLIDGVFLQDVGLLNRLGKLEGNEWKSSGESITGQCGEGASDPEEHRLTLVWSFMGVARNRAVNLLHYQFLESLAPVLISENRSGHLQAMQDHGIPVMPTYGWMTYATVNRLCYYRYQNVLGGVDCRHMCLAGRQHMVNDVFHMDMTVDGYMLGKKYEYADLVEKPGLIYARDYEECEKRIQKLREIEHENIGRHSCL